MLTRIAQTAVSHDGQHIHPDGGQAWDHAGEDVQQGGEAAGRDLELLGEGLEHLTGDDDADAVVADAQVDQADHGRNKVLGALAGLDAAGGLGQQPVDAAMSWTRPTMPLRVKAIRQMEYIR
jgi:hypothetical protein